VSSESAQLVFWHQQKIGVILGLVPRI